MGVSYVIINFKCTYYLFITDAEDLLIGVVGLRELVSAPANMRIADLLITDIVRRYSNEVFGPAHFDN